MCVRMVRDNIPCSYDPQGDFLEQTKNCTEVLVDYLPEDGMIKKFLQEIQKCAKNGTQLNLNVKVNYGSYLAGFKTKKDIQRALSDISLNEIVKLLALSQHGAEKTLEELSSMCLNREVNGK
jgi:hypothetical protein